MDGAEVTVDECDGTEEEASGRGLFLLPLLLLPLLLLLLKRPDLVLLPSSGLFLASLIGSTDLVLLMLVDCWLVVVWKIRLFWVLHTSCFWRF